VVATLDQILKRMAERQAAVTALADSGGVSLTWGDLDARIGRLAGLLRSIGLPEHASVGLQVESGIDQIVSVFAAWRAGLVAVILPAGWRRHDVSRATQRLGLRALVGTPASAEALREAAADCFTVRFVCAFGQEVPDGVVPIDAMIGDAAPVEAPDSGPDAARRICFVTFETGGPGTIAVARSTTELIAAAIPVLAEARLSPRARLASMLAPGSLASFVVPVVPWLLTGGTLTLDAGADGELPDAADVVVVPGALIGRLPQARRARTLLAVWKAPERWAGSAAPGDTETVVDIACAGETGLFVRRRSAVLSTGIPLDVAHPGMGPGAGPLLEVQATATGTLALRGAMVPTLAWPPGAERSDAAVLAVGADAFVDTRLPVRVDRGERLVFLDQPPPGTAGVGGTRFSMAEAQDLVRRIAPDASLTAVPDALLGTRLVGVAENRLSVARALVEAGAHPLLVAAFRPRGA
jgi:hypothetical protein